MTDDRTIAVYDAQVDQYADFVQRLSVEPALLRFIERLNSGDLVLDLGCGPAHSSATLREHGLRVDPVDASAQMVRLANDTFDIAARQAQFSDIDATHLYHGVWANFSLLHARSEDFPGILAALHTALKPSGLLHLGMKLGSGSTRDKLDRYYSYYSEGELREHLRRAGFETLAVVLGEGAGLAGDVEPWIVLQGRATSAA